MCRAGIRHCQPTEAQKKAASERRKKNRELKKAVIEKLLSEDRDDLVYDVKKLSPSHIRDYLENHGIKTIHEARGLPHSPAYEKLRNNVLSHGDYGIKEGEVIADEEKDDKLREIKDGMKEDLKKVLKLHNGSFDDDSQVIMHHALEQIKHLPISIFPHENREYWQEFVDQVVSESDVMKQKEEIMRKHKERLNVPEAVKDIDIDRDYLVADDGVIPQSFLDRMNKEASHMLDAGNHLDIRYYQVGERDYHVVDTTFGDGYFLRKLEANKGYISNFSSGVYRDEFSYMHGMLDDVDDDAARNIFSRISTFTLLNDGDDFESIINRHYHINEEVKERLLNELIMTSNYHNRKTYYQKKRGYVPFSPTVEDIRMFGGGIQVDKENIVDVKNADDLMSQMRDHPEEFNDKEESDEFVHGYSSDYGDVRYAVLHPYTMSGYSDAIKDAQGVKKAYRPYTELITSLAEDFEQNKKDKSPRMLKRTMQPPFGFNSLEAFSHHFPVGSTLHTTRLTSTSADLDFKANEHDNVILHFNTRKGISIINESSFKEEREVVIGSNASFTVVGNELIDDELHIYLTDEELVVND